MKSHQPIQSMNVFSEVRGHSRGIRDSFLQKLKSPGLVAYIEIAGLQFLHSEFFRVKSHMNVFHRLELWKREMNWSLYFSPL